MDHVVLGVIDDDPHRWLEDETPDARAWEAAQDHLATGFLHGLRTFAHLSASMNDSPGRGRLFAPLPAGRRWFRRPPSSGVPTALLEVADAPAGPWRQALSARTDGSKLDYFFPSPDGSHVAVGISQDGSEVSTLHVLDVASVALRPDEIPFTPFAYVAWLPDSSGFYFNGLSMADGGRMRLFFHEVGCTAPVAPEPVEPEGRVLIPQVSPDGRYVGVVAGFELRLQYVLDRHGDAGWQSFLPDATGTCVGVFEGDRYVTISTEGAPKGRLVAIPLGSSQDRSAWAEIVPEGEEVLRNVTRAGGYLVVGAFADLGCRLLVYTLEGERVTDVPLPGSGTVGLTPDGARLAIEPWVAAAPDADVVSFVFNSFDRAPEVHVHDLRTGEGSVVERVPASLGDVVIHRSSATCADGTEVPFSLIHRRDLDTAELNPVIISAYGGFNVLWQPRFLWDLAPFIDAGGIVAWASLRGGGERGDEWWQAGRLENKQQTFDDLYAVADTLVGSGVTTPDRLGLVGASNGGLLAGVAATQRPTLFAAIVSLVPLLDMLRFTRDPIGAIATGEYGDPDDPAGAEVLRAYSPYHNVRPGVRYPSVLVACTANDARCPSWHGRKFVAALQAATTGDAPILLRVWSAGGHLAGGASAPPDTVAEWLAFLMAELGL